MPLTKDTLAKFRTGNVFFETGTYKGEGIERALAAGFSKIYSVEVDQNWVDFAIAKFREHVDSGRVKIIKGDTKQIMGDVLKEINEPITFWLDAHWDLGPVKGEADNPLYDELAFIKSHPVKTHLIMIDDMRLMGADAYHWGKTMRRDKIISDIMTINPSYKITYTDGDLGPQYGGLAKNDIMVAHL